MELNFPIVIDFVPKYDVNPGLEKRSIRRMDVAHLEADKVIALVISQFENHANILTEYCRDLISGGKSPRTVVELEKAAYREFESTTGANILDFDELNFITASPLNAMYFACHGRRRMAAYEYAGLLVGLLYYLSENSYYQQIYDVQKETGLAADLWGVSQERDMPPDSSDAEELMQLADGLTETLFDGLKNVYETAIYTESDTGVQFAVDNELDDMGFAVSRQAHTETTRIVNDSQSRALALMGISQYRYLTEQDALVCEFCRALNQKVFLTKDKATGINYPPMHPNCRCQTMPVVTKEAVNFLKGQSSFLPYSYMTVPRDMGYERWLKEWEIALTEIMPE